MGRWFNSTQALDNSPDGEAVGMEKVMVPGSDVNPAIPGKDSHEGPRSRAAPAPEPNNTKGATMAKHTYGFPAGTEPRAAIAQAITRARADGYCGPNETPGAEIIETDEHRHTPDHRLPANRPGQGRPAAEMCVVIRSSN